MSKRAALVVLVAMIASAVVLALSASASASNGGVYMVTPTWWGWCPGSSVFHVDWWTSGTNGGDSGDDIVWVPVNLHQWNNVTLTVWCRGWALSGTQNVDIYPTRNGQAWFVGAGGGTWHN